MSEQRLFYVEAIERAVRAALEDPEAVATPAALAERAGFSAFYFSRLFAGIVGESPGAFLRRLRLERAAAALLEGRSVTETAFASGYESVEAVSRAFRAAFGVPPSELPAAGLVPALPSAAAIHATRAGERARIALAPRRGGTEMDVEVREGVRPRQVLALRHTGAYWKIGAAMGRLFGLVGSLGGVRPAGPPLAIFHDDPGTTPEESLRSDACVEVAPGSVSADAAASAGLSLVTLEGGREAVHVHVGPYSALPAAWARLIGEWLPSSGRRVAAGRPSYEVYLDDCDTTAPEKLRTELRVPLE